MRKSFTHNGKRYYVTANTKKELDKKVANKKKELQTPVKPYTFIKWTEEFLDTYKSNLTHETLLEYNSRIKKFLFPALGRKKLTDIKAIDCQKIFNKMNGYSSNYIHKVYNDLHQILETAYINDLVEKNVSAGVILPKGHRTTRRAITNEERNVLHTVANYHSHGLYFLMMLYCGLRPHEASFIQGKDVDGNILHIRGKKTKESDRYVPIPNHLLGLLPKLDADEYMFKSIRNISPLTERHRDVIWKSFREEMNKYMDVKDDFTPYCLRHTYCTDLQDAGIPITVAKNLMGHSTIKLTADIYTHNSDETFNNSVDKINAHFLHTNFATELSETK